MAVTYPHPASESPPVDVPADEPAPSLVPPFVRNRLSPGVPADRVTSWLWTALIAAIAFGLRIVNLDYPKKTIFDEVYYAKDAHDLLRYGTEQNNDGTGPGYVVHPPLGKWMIGAGEYVFGYNSFGWRISATVIGAISVLVLVRIGRRMFGSTLLGCLAGLLLSLDGLHFVMSRVALLDIFLMFWLLVGFGCLLLDRDHRRSLLLRRLEAGEDLSAGTRRGIGTIPWWRLAAAVCLGLALGVKWSATWYVVGFAVLMLLWDVSARRVAGVRRPVRDVLVWESPWLLVCAILLLGTYLACWTGWFSSNRGWNRFGDPWAGPKHWWLPEPLGYLWAYHQHAYEFHTHLTTAHDYQSTPWSWLFLGRPVAYYYSSDPGCGAPSCSAEVLALGTPLLWWSFIPALIVSGWRWLARRDWTAGAILLAVAVGIVPWTFYPERTMFFFYTLPALPFMVLAVTQSLGMLLGPADAARDRRIIGAVAVACYVAVVAATFAYFYPIYTGQQLTYAAWHNRMWFDSWI